MREQMSINRTSQATPLLPSAQIVFAMKCVNGIAGDRSGRQTLERGASEIEQIAQTLDRQLLDQRREWFEQQLSQQQRLTRVQRDLLDNLLHQIRNPLTALRTFGKLLLKRLIGDANRAVADNIVREAIASRSCYNSLIR